MTVADAPLSRMNGIGAEPATLTSRTIRLLTRAAATAGCTRGEAEEQQDCREKPRISQHERYFSSRRTFSIFASRSVVRRSRSRWYSSSRVARSAGSNSDRMRL